MLISCAGCDKPILDKFLLNVLERTWHTDCVRCYDCRSPLSDKCFSRDNKLFCRPDFYRRYGTKCGGCNQGISPSDLVRKAREKVFHLNCFTCLICRKQLSTGEELYVLDDNKFICKDDYLHGNGGAANLAGSGGGGGGGGGGNGNSGSGGGGKVAAVAAATATVANAVAAALANQNVTAGNAGGPSSALTPHHHLSSSASSSQHQQDSLLGSGSDDDDDDDASTTSSVLQQHKGHGLLTGGHLETNNNSLSHSDVSVSMGQDNSKTGFHDDSEDQNSLDGDLDTRDSQTENKSPDDGNSGSKRRGPRTTIKAKQLEILKAAFSQTPKPTRHIREQLAKDTGLPMRVIQVWFQNKRSKERRLKQLTSMGRGPFFGNSRKMRGFPMNLSPGSIPGLDDTHPGFPFFAPDPGAKFDFGGPGPYGPPGSASGPLPPHFHPMDAGSSFFQPHTHPHMHPHSHQPPNGPFSNQIDHNAMVMVPGDFGPPPPPPQQQQQQQQSQLPSQQQSTNQNQGAQSQSTGSGASAAVDHSRSTSSPSEFLNNPNFNENQPLQNEGLVW